MFNEYHNKISKFLELLFLWINQKTHWRVIPKNCKFYLKLTMSMLCSKIGSSLNTKIILWIQRQLPMLGQFKLFYTGNRSSKSKRERNFLYASSKLMPLQTYFYDRQLTILVKMTLLLETHFLCGSSRSVPVPALVCPTIGKYLQENTRLWIVQTKLIIQIEDESAYWRK